MAQKQTPPTDDRPSDASPYDEFPTSFGHPGVGQATKVTVTNVSDKAKVADVPTIGAPGQSNVAPGGPGPIND
jgi:hypothetical protein